VELIKIAKLGSSDGQRHADHVVHDYLVQFRSQAGGRTTVAEERSFISRKFKAAVPDTDLTQSIVSLIETPRW
jgi:hypothetical protein